MDMWLAGAPHIEILSPDIYGGVSRRCATALPGREPAVHPRDHSSEEATRNLFVALGQYDALGTSPFAVDSIRTRRPARWPAVCDFATARARDPRAAGKGRSAGFVAR